MKSALLSHGCFSPLPIHKHFCSPSTVRFTLATALPSGHGSSSFSLSGGSGSRTLAIQAVNKSPGPVIQSSHKSPRSEEIQKLDKSPGSATSDNKAMRLTTAGATLVFACALGIIGCCGSKEKPYVAIAGPREIFQKAPPTVVPIHPLGGKAALKSLLDVTVNLASGKIEPFTRGPAFYLPARPSKEEIDKIKMEAVRQMKLGKAEDAVLLLRRAYNNYRNDPEPAYNVEMALVEILICLGRYKEASECNCLGDSNLLISDDRAPLYKAIICTMLDKKEEAKLHWEDFAEAVAQGGF